MPPLESHANVRKINPTAGGNAKENGEMYGAENMLYACFLGLKRLLLLIAMEVISPLGTKSCTELRVAVTKAFVMESLAAQVPITGRKIPVVRR